MDLRRLGCPSMSKHPTQIERVITADMPWTYTAWLTVYWGLTQLAYAMDRVWKDCRTDWAGW